MTAFPSYKEPLTLNNQEYQGMYVCVNERKEREQKENSVKGKQKLVYETPSSR